MAQNKRDNPTPFGDLSADPRSVGINNVPGEGGNKRYQGTGQNRQSQVDYSDPQLQALRNLLEEMGIRYNQDLEAGGNPAGDPNSMPNWVTASDIDPVVARAQPSWQADPWSMMQPGQAGGRPSPEMDQFGPTGSWMDLLSGHPGAGRPGAGSQAPRRMMM